MEKRTHTAVTVLSAVGMLVLIFDGRTAMAGAIDGMEICLRTVIPSLFPFFVLSILLTGSLSGMRMPILAPLGRLCSMPKSAESLLLIGLLGGYPVGAQVITQAFEQGQLSKQEAHRLLGFCSNAGPAFIFGIAGSLFSSSSTAWLLWGIHILSAVAVGSVLPGRHTANAQYTTSTIVTLPSALSKALKTMANVCGWIILFRVIIAFLNRWLLWLLPETLQLLTVGLLELANGCHSLTQTQSEAIRFMISASILGFGGVCVGMQTISVTGSLGTGMYFPGKVLQGLLSLALSSAIAPVMFPDEHSAGILTTAVLSAIGFCFTLLIISSGKKTVAFCGKQVYNN